VDNLKAVPNAEKEKISLALGDPTLFGNFKVPQVAVEEVIAKVSSFSANGYPPSTGYEHVREAVANKFSCSESPLEAKDVIIASGCSGALDLVISVIGNEGHNILLPRPGFSLYETLAASLGIECRFYNLIPEKDWEIDLTHLESLIDGNTVAILINNPSNPCGSVFSKKHLHDILNLAEKRHLPIISDEIYADMAFHPFEFVPIAKLSKNVPILTVGGLAKQYLVPGWRLGWILIHDRNGLFSEVRKGLVSLSQRTLGASSLIQSVVPKILNETPESFYKGTLDKLQENARISKELLSGISGLKVVIPQGAMYMMVGIDVSKFRDIKNDLEFTEKLLTEESVVCLPGQVSFTPFLRPPNIISASRWKTISESCSQLHQKSFELHMTELRIFVRGIQYDDESFAIINNNVEV
jgi:tyrosine aminotransferase